jgi:hypothetical protein
VKLFRVVPKPRLADQADGKYTWRLPGVNCDVCKKPIGQPSGYPNLDIRGKLDEDLFTLRFPGDPKGPRGRISWDEYEQLKTKLQKLLGADKPLFPGMGFGPFRGSVVHTEKRDFVWVWPEELLPSESTYEKLTQAGLQIPTGPANIKDRKTGEVREDYRRIVDLRIVACMAIQTLEFTAESRQCRKCGLVIVKRPERLFLKKDAVPRSLTLFTPEETGSIIATEDFASTVAKLKFSNIAFEPVDLV